MNAGTYGIIATVSYSSAVVLAIIAIIVFFTQHIREVRDELTGRTAARTIAEMRAGRRGTIRVAGAEDIRVAGAATGDIPQGEKSGSLRLRRVDERRRSGLLGSLGLRKKTGDVARTASAIAAAKPGSVEAGSTGAVVSANETGEGKVADTASTAAAKPQTAQDTARSVIAAVAGSPAASPAAEAETVYFGSTGKTAASQAKAASEAETVNFGAKAKVGKKAKATPAEKPAASSEAETVYFGSKAKGKKAAQASQANNDDSPAAAASAASDTAHDANECETTLLSGGGAGTSGAPGAPKASEALTAPLSPKDKPGARGNKRENKKEVR